MSRDEEDIGRIIRNTGLHQGQGSSPAIFALTMDALVWRRVDEICRCRRYGFDIGTTRTAHLSRADDNMLLASSAEELQHMFDTVDELATACRSDVNQKVVWAQIARMLHHAC